MSVQSCNGVGPVAPPPQGSNGRDLKAKTRGELLLVQEGLDMPANEQPPVGHWVAGWFMTKATNRPQRVQ